MHKMNSSFLFLLLIYVLVIARASMPLQRHLAFSGKPRSIVISWLTHEKLSEAPTVKYSTKMSGPYQFAQGNTSKYYLSYHHDVLVTNLEPGVKYFYMVGADGFWSDISEFVAPDVERKGFSVAIYGDMGVENSKDTMDKIYDRSSNFDFVYHVGDIAYADDKGIVGDNKFYEETYNEWAQRMEPITKSKPFMVCPGNHDVTCHSFGRIPRVSECPTQLGNFSAYLHRFKMPYETSKGPNNLWFSFNYRGAHFISINTESDYPGSPGLLFMKYGGFGNQIAWLENDLRNVNRSWTPWVIVVGHRPMYTTNYAVIDFPFGQRRRLQKAMEHILFKYRVDFYIAGHVHAYERHFPAFQSRCLQRNYQNPRGPIHIVVGSAGNTEGHSKLSKEEPEYLAYRNAVHYGFGELQIYNESVAEWRYIAATTGDVDDKVTIYRNQHSPETTVTESISQYA